MEGLWAMLRTLALTLNDTGAMGRFEQRRFMILLEINEG